MFIGNLVKLKPDTTRINTSEKMFINNAIQEDWIWLVTSIDGDNVDCLIQPLYLEDDVIILGADLLVLFDEIEEININKEELFNELRKQQHCC